MAHDNDLQLPRLEEADPLALGTLDAPVSAKSAADLEQVFDVPVTVSAVLGNARMPVGDLLKLAPGAVLELDRKVGEAIDIYVNNRLVVLAEPDIAPGDCRIEWADGGINRDSAATTAAIDEAVKRYIEARQTSEATTDSAWRFDR